MYGLILSLHVLICFAMVLVILLQSGKGGGLAGAFGGGGTTIFGGRGATTVLTRATMVLGSLFFVTSLTLALLSIQRATGARSLLQQEAQRAGEQQQGQPTGQPASPSSPTLPSGGAVPAPPPAQAPAPSGGGAANPSTPPQGGR